ncbi:hypothetical protein HK103_004267 [Boothiomyces macroporosus]|uniref:Uncharacterized protein n=1 Tax=Boothiomyces macroporosus TaxID=261099 RepID=A0AAD5Y466_9FUNG|nr:hypothetical protein HK103_004267 [Boothiomyces macroporosus]
MNRLEQRSFTLDPKYNIYYIVGGAVLGIMILIGCCLYGCNKKKARYDAKLSLQPMTIQRKKEGTLSFLRKGRAVPKEEPPVVNMEMVDYDGATNSGPSTSFHSPALSHTTVSHYSAGAYYPPIQPQPHSPYIQPHHEHVQGYYLHAQRQSQSDYYTDSFRNSSNYSEHIIPNYGTHTYADFIEPQIPVDAYSVTRSSVAGTDRYSQYPSLDNMQYNSVPIVDIHPIRSPSFTTSYHTAHIIDKIHSGVYHQPEVYNTPIDQSHMESDIFSGDLDHSIRAISNVGSDYSRSYGQGKGALTFEQLEKQTRESAVGVMDVNHEKAEPSLPVMVDDFKLESAIDIAQDNPAPDDLSDLEPSDPEQDQNPRFDIEQDLVRDHAEPSTTVDQEKEAGFELFEEESRLERFSDIQDVANPNDEKTPDAMLADAKLDQNQLQYDKVSLDSIEKSKYDGAPAAKDLSNSENED